MSPAEQQKIRARAWYVANREKTRERSRAWYEANRGRALKSTSERVAANPERKRDHNRAWRLANPEKKRDYNRTWWAANLERARDQQRAKNQRRRASIKTSVSEAPTARQLASILKNPCLYCGAPAEHIDHYIPLARCGAHTLDNLVPACARCNCSKGSKLPGVEWKGCP